MALAPTGLSTASSGGRTTTRSADVVAVLNGESSAQVFEKARPLRATIFEVSTLMEHPIENGSSIADHKVTQPVEIELPVVLSNSDDYKQTFAEIRQLFNSGTFLTVQTRVASYSKMVLLEMPHEETPEEFDSVTIGLRFREALVVTATYGGLAPAQVKAKPKASTVKRGAQQTTKAPAPVETRGSVLYGLFHQGGK
jgi:hypothetical protein